MAFNLDFTGASQDQLGLGGSLGSKAISNQSMLGFDDSSGNILGGTDGIGGNIWGEGGMANMAIGGLKTLGSIWSSYQQFKLAKDALKFQKSSFKTNLQNSQQVYNTALEDRVRARYVAENRPGEADAYIEKNKLG